MSSCRFLLSDVISFVAQLQYSVLAISRANWCVCKIPYPLVCFSIIARDKKTLSALTTFHFLRNYAALPVDTLADFAKIIDDPSNGMALQSDAHQGFNNFAWSLKEVKDVSSSSQLWLQIRFILSSFSDPAHIQGGYS